MIYSQAFAAAKTAVKLCATTDSLNVQVNYER